MIRYFVKFCFFLLSALLPCSYGVASPPPQLEAALLQLFGEPPLSIEESKVKGLYSVIYKEDVFYFTKDASILFRGDLYQLDQVRSGYSLSHSITTARFRSYIKNVIDDFDESKMVVYPAKDARGKMTVLTDLLCSDCKKIHGEISQYNANGLTVRYVLLTGYDDESPTYAELENLWCSKNKTTSISRYISGELTKPANCNSPINMHGELWFKLGSPNLPATYTPRGRKVDGFLPVDELRRSQAPEYTKRGKELHGALARKVDLIAKKGKVIDGSYVPGVVGYRWGGDVIYGYGGKLHAKGSSVVILNGEFIDVKNKINLTAQAKRRFNKEFLKKTSEDEMIIYPAANEKTKITVFTDVDCQYCNKLHGEIDQYNANGITVQYLAFPRTGLKYGSYRKARNVWCSANPLKAMTRAQRGLTVRDRECSNPVKKHYHLGHDELGVGGTPTIFLEDGRRINGYMPVKKMIKVLYNKQ